MFKAVVQNIARLGVLGSGKAVQYWYVKIMHCCLNVCVQCLVHICLRCCLHFWGVYVCDRFSLSLCGCGRFARSLAPSIARTVARWLAQSLARAVDRSVVRSVDRAVGRSIVRSIARSPHRSFGLSPIAHSLARSVNP